MSTAATRSVWSLRHVQTTLGLSRRAIEGLVAARFVTPARGPRNALCFSFQDLVLLRTADALRRAQVPPRRILQALGTLRAQLPPSVPLTGLRITAEGADVVVRGSGAPRDATSGQLVMDFEVVPCADGDLTWLNVLAPAPAASAASTTTAETAAAAQLARGEALEAHDRSAAKDAYRRALQLDAGLLDAYVSLGAMLCEDGACGEAVSVFESALARGVADSLLHFNHAIALEDLGQSQAAIASYGKALALDPGFADAHFNLARLLQAAGDLQGALRHWSAYRRLQRTPPT